MENLVAEAETRSGVARNEIAPQMVFVSHETYTPARGGSASAEIHALRRVFGDGADQIVIANTKGMTGHAMATGIEDVLAVKALETGLVPPVANFKEVDPELGPLNLSKGGAYPVEYALHLGAGFGSQISMILLRWVPTKDGVRRSPKALGYAYRIADPRRLERLAEPDGRPSGRRTGSGPPDPAGARPRAGGADGSDQSKTSRRLPAPTPMQPPTPEPASGQLRCTLTPPARLWRKQRPLRQRTAVAVATAPAVEGESGHEAPAPTAAATSPRSAPAIR